MNPSAPEVVDASRKRIATSGAVDMSAQLWKCCANHAMIAQKTSIIGITMRCNGFTARSRLLTRAYKFLGMFWQISICGCRRQFFAMQIDRSTSIMTSSSLLEARRWENGQTSTAVLCDLQTGWFSSIIFDVSDSIPQWSTIPSVLLLVFSFTFIQCYRYCCFCKPPESRSSFNSLLFN